MLVHDIGVQAVRNEAGQRRGSAIVVGGGQGRTPMIGHVIREFLPAAELLNYFDAILRVYNRYGRRDNIYKARIKILVKELTPAEFARQVEAEWERCTRRAGHGPARGDRPARRALRRSAVPRVHARQRRAPRRGRRQPPVRTLGRAQRARAQAPRLRDRHAVVEAHRHAARRRYRERDGRDRRARRSLQLRRSARHARAEPGVRRRPPVGPLRAVDEAEGARVRDAQHRPPDRHRLLPRRRLLLARQREVDPDRRSDPAPLRRSRLRARPGRPRAQHLRLHERLRPSSRRPHRHPRRRQERRGVVPGLDRRRAGQRRVARQGDRPFVRRGRDARRRRPASSMSTSSSRHDDERFIDTVRRIGLEPFKERVYAAAH